MPFLFLAFPPLLIVSFAMEVEAAVFALPLLAVTACLASASQSGPIWLNPTLSMANRIFVLQVFLGAAALKGLAVGALLDERRHAHRSANQARMIYETLLENADDMIILSSLDGAWRFVSPAVKKITGWTPREYLAQGPLDVVHPEDRELAQAILSSLADGKSHLTFRFRAPCRGGGYSWVESSLRGIRLPGEMGLTGYVATLRDISRLKLAEESWVAERADLAQKNRDLAEQALRDELTGIPNRRAFNSVLDIELARLERSEQPIALLMIDMIGLRSSTTGMGTLQGTIVSEQLPGTCSIAPAAPPTLWHVWAAKSLPHCFHQRITANPSLCLDFAAFGSVRRPVFIRLSRNFPIADDPAETRRMRADRNRASWLGKQPAQTK